MHSQIEALDDFAGWLEWLQNDTAAENFSIYCLDNFWNILKDDFKQHLHPEAVNEIEKDTADPLGNYWHLWNMFLFLVLDEKKLEILVNAFVNSNRYEFEEWCIANTIHDDSEY